MKRVDGVMTMEEAWKRATAIKPGVIYNVHISLSDIGDDTYHVTERIIFNGLQLLPSMWVELSVPHKLDYAILNGRELSYDTKEARLYFDTPAEGVLELAYTNKYDRDGYGLHVYDEDGERFLYTNFEPYRAHRVFACFDQPSIPGILNLSLRAPSKWIVLGNMGVDETRNNPSDDTATRVFARSNLMPTYTFAFAAGMIESFSDYGANNIHGHVYMRSALARQLTEDRAKDEAHDFARASTHAIKFFTKNLRSEFPYPGKCDNVLCPEFNSGAMENPGLITYTERYLNRSTLPTTDEEHARRMTTVVHEFAHMWFGNMITIHWWTALWLNETLATYLAHIAMLELIVPSSNVAMVVLVQNELAVRRAIHRDQLTTTHPVAGSAVPDTEYARVVFDAVTYNKGAALLAEIHHRIGDTAFWGALSTYVNTYAFKTVRTKNFTDLFPRSELAFKDLFDTSGVRVVRYDPVKLISSVIPATKATVKPVDNIRMTKLILYSGREVSYPADSLYIDFRLSADSWTAFVKENPPFYQSLPLATRLWCAAYEDVRQGEISADRFVGPALAAARRLSVREDTKTVVAMLLEMVLHLILLLKIKDNSYEKALKIALGVAVPVVRQSWVNFAIGCAAIDKGIAERLRDDLLADRVPEFPRTDRDVQWQILLRRCAWGLDGPADVKQQLDKDPTERGRLESLKCLSALPENKERIWANSMLCDRGGSLQEETAKMAGFWQMPMEDTDIMSYGTLFFVAVLEVYKKSSPGCAAAFFANMAPPPPGQSPPMLEINAMRTAADLMQTPLKNNRDLYVRLSDWIDNFRRLKNIVLKHKRVISL